MNINHIPRFFKVFLVPTCSQKLGIPLAFLSHVGGALPNKAFLHNRHGNWGVTISRDEDQFSFEGGWGRFVIDNNIKDNEFLVFRYDGRNIFDVTIYGHHGCDKEIFPQNYSVKKENEDESDEENEEESNDSTGKDENFEETNDFDLNDGDYEEESDKEIFPQNYSVKKENEDESDEENEEESNDSTGKDENFEETNDFDLNDGDYEEESEEKKPEVEHLMKRKGRKRLAKKAKKTKNVKHEEGFDDGDDNDDDVFKYGIISHPENPYFVTKLRATRTNDLFIPLDVIKDHDLKLPKEMIIRDGRMRKWKTRVVKWTDGRTWLTKGYKAFIKWNHFKKQDRCICEFINGKDETGIYLKMTILRAGSWLPKGNI